MDYNQKKNIIRTTKIGISIFIIVCFFFLLLGNCFYTIKENQQVVLTTLGKAETITKTGLNFKIPFIQKVKKVDTTIQGLEIGYHPSGKNDGQMIEEESLMITSDYNFINIDFYVSYQVTDPQKYLFASSDPILILNNLAQNCIRTVISSYTVDAVLTTGKSEIQSNIKQMIITNLEQLDIGLTLKDITIQDAQPPNVEVMDAFKAVETAKQNKEAAINSANKYRNEQLPAAKADADQIVQNADAEKESRINEANGQVARFEQMYKEYKKYPFITKQRMFYETMEEVLPNLKVIIDGTEKGEITKMFPLESFSSSSSFFNSSDENIDEP